MRPSALASFCLLAAACGDGPGGNPTADGGTPADVGIERPDGIVRPDADTPTFVPTEPAPPEIPWLDSGPLGPVSLPVLTPCPSGWREIPPADALSPAVCDPWPESAMREDCADDEAHFPGEPDCARIGPECPSGDWADDLPADSRILYVRAGESPGGDGTRERPFGTIARAIAIAVDGDVIALSKGTFAESAVMYTSGTLWGACVAATRVLSVSTLEEHPGTVARALRLSIGDSSTIGVRVGAGTTIDLEDVVVARATSAAVFVEGGTLTARNVVLRDTTVNAEGIGFGMTVSLGGRAEINRVAVLRVGGTGFEVFDSGQLVATRVVVAHVAETSRSQGAGMRVLDGGSVVASEVVVSDWAGQGLRVNGGDDMTTASLTDVVFRRSAADAISGIGVHVDGVASVTIRRASIDGARIAGMLALFDGHIDLEDVVVTNTLPGNTAEARGLGIIAGEAGSAHARRIVLNGGSGGMLVNGRADVEDVVARGAVGERAYALGIEASRGGTLSLRRALLVENVGTGLNVRDRGTTADVSDVAARDNGHGVTVFGSIGAGGPPMVHATRLLVGGPGTGVYAASGGQLELQDFVVRDNGSASAVATNGLAALPSGSIRGSRILIAGTYGVGVMGTFDSTLVLEDARVEGTRPRACASEPCELGFGLGVGAYDGAAVELSRFAITDNVFGGLQLANDGTIDLHDGRVSGHEVGANVQTVGFDVGRLFDRVLFVDNGIDVDGSLLAVPDAPEDP